MYTFRPDQIDYLFHESSELIFWLLEKNCVGALHTIATIATTADNNL